ncbi:hypothetical protein BAUCODRAFT_539120 [Baudoinia panamericana UAMH 10762]|uniref:Uncharacterized protein n=1 Tax=Baudoinia panamericana (strain UAMH 10762) TaxID=717646 RepID=M2LM34_BAUPA|nr:uncharacterized protein BAUCODRAFT_539120 [Baudoinia panamericana UAMH 10762]EMC95382.1 hypothetical protein BAUCODRAFT_539120 [Baudoinia panamericana UAMH 10762]
MQVAEVLSDLSTLYLADPKAAAALIRYGNTNVSSSQGRDNDPDLKRARDLLELHAEVKVAHQHGNDRELSEARQAVDRIMNELK